MKINIKNYWSKTLGIDFKGLGRYNCLLMSLEHEHYMEYTYGLKGSGMF